MLEFRISVVSWMFRFILVFVSLLGVLREAEVHLKIKVQKRREDEYPMEHKANNIHICEYLEHSKKNSNRNKDKRCNSFRYYR